jgi:anaerobic ribonucleoside-triphosphate reductase activating protein
MTPLVQVVRIEPATSAEGPGVRWAIWVQGCSIGCAGCCNPHTWAFRDDEGVSVTDLIGQMLDAPVEGITLLGGEPFDQAPALAVLGEAAQRAGRGVMTFSGYRYETLQQPRPGWTELLSVTDLLVDGPYLSQRRDDVRPWVGSTNQRFIHLTDRYRSLDLGSERDRVELRIRRDGTVTVNGWPEAGLLGALDDLLAEDL